MEEEKKNVFLDFWTLKESYIKAKGRGLSIPLDKFSFIISRDCTAICFDDSYKDDPDNFIFFRFPLLDNFKAAITVQAPEAKGVGVSIYRCIPFKEMKRQDHINVI